MGDAPGVPTVAIVVPVLDEVEVLAGLAEHLAATAPAAEVVVVDGGSADGSAREAERLGLRVIEAPRGRGPQMNAGAAATRAERLLFLHADTRLPEAATDCVVATLADPKVALGAFAFRFDRRGVRLGFVEGGARLRNRVAGVPYGDQALFLKRRVFEGLGGFRSGPMEDLDLVLRARRTGRVVVRPEPAVTSARRYVERGPLRLMLRHWALTARWGLGWRPEGEVRR